MPFFSVVLITYNRADLLPRCIDSVINQTFDDWELIIVDNYSEDGTKELIEGYMARDSRIKFKQIHNNNVLAMSRNEGIRMSKGLYICTLDSDDWYTEDKLQTVYDICRNKVYDVLYSKFQLMSAEGAGKVYGTSLSWDNTFLELLINGCKICNPTTIVKKTAWEEVGYLSEEPELSAVEDIDGWLKMAFVGKKFHFIDKMLTYNWIGSNMSHSPKQVVRVKALYDKWLQYVNCENKNNVMGGRDYLCGRIYHQIGDYLNARVYYKYVLNNKETKWRTKALILYVAALLRLKK